MIEARHFVIYTDHKPITYAFAKKSSQCTPRQFRYLDYISQFSTDIRHVAGEDNVVADALSRIDEVQVTLNYEALATSQESDEELKNHVNGQSGLLLKKIKIPDTSVAVFCDVSTDTARPFITKPFRKIAFDTVHRLSHPGQNATVKLVTQRFVWPSVKTDCRRWARACIQCQRAKVTRHVTSPTGAFVPPTSRFEHIHVDIIVMPPSQGYRYCLTCVDRFTRWPEAIPLENQEAETVARALYANWICRFGTPLRITTDQGRQFESYLFKRLNSLTGTTHLRTTAFHPAANGMVERFHRQLKAAIKCHQNDGWVNVLPTVLLGIRSAWKEDLQATAAEMVYGQQLRLPGEFLRGHESDLGDNGAADFARELRQHMQSLRPALVKRRGEKRIFIFKDLATAKQVFVRSDGVKKQLQNAYDGPFSVIERDDKTFTINVRGRVVKVSIDRVKPAYVVNDDMCVSDASDDTDEQDGVIIPPTVCQPGDSTTAKFTTRSGRKVQFPDRLQAGFS